MVGIRNSGALSFDTPPELAREIAEDMRKKKRDPEDLTAYDRAIIGGNSCRIEIPLRDKFLMRKVAEMLRGYAETLDNYSHRTDLPDRAILGYIRDEAKRINWVLRQSKPRGRPKKIWEE